MRAIYAAQLRLDDKPDSEQVVAQIAAWFAQGRAPDGVVATWQAPGNHDFDVPVDGHTLNVEVLDSAAGKLWQATWRHPHADDPNVHVVSQATLAETEDECTIELVLRTVQTTERIAPSHFSILAPRLIRDLVTRFVVYDGDRRMRAEPQVLSSGGVPQFAQFLLSPSRTRPVVLLTDDVVDSQPNVDPYALAQQLAGLGHVYFTMHGLPGIELRKMLGGLGCPRGSMRVWWPGMSLDDPPPPSADPPSGAEGGWIDLDNFQPLQTNLGPLCRNGRARVAHCHPPDFPYRTPHGR